MSERRNVVVDGQEFTVVRYWVIGSGLVVFTALEEESGKFPESSHSSVYSFGGGESLGKVYSRRLPERLANLPSYTVDRYDRVVAWSEGLKKFCHKVILEAYPELVESGNVRISGEDYELIFENGAEAKAYCGLS